MGTSMRLPRSLCLHPTLVLALTWPLGSALHAQATKDPAAVSAINTALASMGGQPALAAVQDAVVTAQIQGAADGQPGTTQFTWKSIGLALRTEATASSGNTISTSQGGIGYIEDATGTVSSMDQRLGHSIFPHHLPGIALLYLLNAPDRSLSIISDTSATPNLVHVLSVQVLSDQSTVYETQQDWYIDMSLGLPTRVDFVIPAPSGPDGTGSVQLISWQKTSTLLMPLTIEVTENGGTPSAISVGTPP